MKRLTQILGAAVIGIASLMLSVPSVEAGRQGGPMTQTIVVPTRQSVYYDMTFVAGERAVVTVTGNGAASLELFVSDAYGHITVGAGSNNRKTARIDVYRTGSFRVQVRNLGAVNYTAVLTTN